MDALALISVVATFGLCWFSEAFLFDDCRTLLCNWTATMDYKSPERSALKIQVILHPKPEEILSLLGTS